MKQDFAARFGFNKEEYLGNLAYLDERRAGSAPVNPGRAAVL